MPRGQVLQAGIRRRIEDSPHQLTVVFPVTSAPPATLPTNPFAGQPPTALAVPTARPAPRVMRCLWADADAPGQLRSSQEQARWAQVGWVTGARAVARVLVDDACVNPAEPFGRTWFDTAEWVEFAGRRYSVLSVTPVNAGFLAPVTLAVWVGGAQQQ